MKKTIFLLSAIIFWSLPYLVGCLNGGGEHVFGGFLINIADANSYLAKMAIGFRGEWKFTLPYTAHPGEGAYIFLFYIILGQISRVLGTSLLAMFHLARLLAAVLMFWSLWRFGQWLFWEKWQAAERYFLLVLMGSGLGWLGSLFFGMTSDLWVAEAYPALAGFVNPHFPLGICLILEILMRAFSLNTAREKFITAILGLLLSIILPFGMVVIAVALLGFVVWEWVSSRRLLWEILIIPLGLGGIFLLYQFVAIQTDPILRLWNDQNITVSPPLWDFIISFSPAIILAYYAIWVKKKTVFTYQWKIVLVWLVLGMLLIYFPFSLQRRFLTAFFIPVSFVGIAGILELSRKNRSRLVIGIILVGSLLTNLLVWSGAWFGVLSKNQNIYLTIEEREALIWLDSHAEGGAIVAASPYMGMIIPARTSMRVIYGHPFETINAEKELSFINALFRGQQDAGADLDELHRRNIRYVFLGPRERAIGEPKFIESLQPVYENSQVNIFEVLP